MSTERSTFAWREIETRAGPGHQLRSLPLDIGAIYTAANIPAEGLGIWRVTPLSNS